MEEAVLDARFDVVIVGAGSSGCALASRLSEKKDRTVLLLEAGTDYGDLAGFPEELKRSYNLSANLPGDPHGWSYMGVLNELVSYPVTRGKVIGGSSAVNGGQFTRGLPSDYDSWADLGCSEWSYEKVLPYLRRLENDLDFGDSRWPGDSGPIPVKRLADSDLNPVARAFVEAAMRLGYPEDPDLNSPRSSGVGLLPHNVVDGIRYNAAVTYLPLGKRPANLTVLDECLALKILVEGRTANGVRVVRRERTFDVHAEEVVLSAGGLNSPHLLLLSGIGPVHETKRLGIEVVENLPGVGKNFMDHPAVNLTYRARRYVPPVTDQPAAQVCLNLAATSSLYGDDLRIFPYSTSKAGMLLGSGRDRLRQLPKLLRRSVAATRALRGMSAAALREDVRHRSDLGVYCGVEVEESRGELSIVTDDPTVPPRVEYHYLAEHSDTSRLREGTRITRELLTSAPFRELGIEITSPLDSEIASDGDLDGWLRSHVRTSYHTAGTCRMGDSDDADSVVDQHCRVLGVENLRVVDISVMPRLTRRGTNATAIMIGERVSDIFDE